MGFSVEIPKPTIIVHELISPFEVEHAIPVALMFRLGGTLLSPLLGIVPVIT